MKITDYIIDLKDSSLQDRLRLRQVLLDNGQIILKSSTTLFKLITTYDSFAYRKSDNTWSGYVDSSRINITIQDFINKFKKRNQIRNLAIYKQSGKPWTEEDYSNIKEFTNTTSKRYVITDKAKYIFDYNNCNYCKYDTWSSQQYDSNIEHCTKIAYEDLFPEEQQVNPFKVGDRIRSISEDNPVQRPYGSEFTVVKIFETNVHYIDGQATHYSKFELVKSAEPEVKFPLFMQNKYGDIFKYISDEYGKMIHANNPDKLPLNVEKWLPKYDCQPEFMKPCDFTTEPEIFDIDWWDARFEAGLPVWYGICGKYAKLKGYALCKTKPSTHIALGFYTANPSCQDNVEANQSTSTQKENTMQHITLQQLLTRLFGAAMPTDYDRRPQYLVVAYNRDGSEMGTATASTLDAVKEKVADTPELWGCKVLTYRLDKEVSVKVPVKATNATVAEPTEED